MRSFLFTMIASAVGFVTTTSAQSICDTATGNLVTNCGFENGTLSGWTLTGNITNPPGGMNGAGYGVDARDANSGNNGLYIGPIGVTATLSQNITMTANTAYSISFYLNQNQAPSLATDGTYTSSSHTFVATIQNTAQTTTLAPLWSFMNYIVGAGSYAVYTSTFTPTAAQLGGSTGQVALVFAIQNDNSYWSLDDVEVTVAAPTITKAFNPTTISPGGTSVVTLTLSNGAVSARTGAAFTDTLANMSAAGGTVTGTCAGTTPGTLTAGATALSFSGITIPATGTCTVIFSVTSSTSGFQPNTTSGVTTTQTPTAGAPSNTATLTVLAPPTIAKAFNPTSIPSGGNSTVTLTLSNSNGGTALTGAVFSDTLVHMSAVGGAVTGTCAGSPASLTAGQTALSFSGITIPASGNCTVIFSVTSTTAGMQPNTTSGVTTTQITTAGAPSNTATLTVQSTPTVVKAFNPSSIQAGGTSTVTLTLSNSNAFALTGGAFTDTLANMTASGGAVTGTCAATPGTLTAGATNLSFSGITISATSSCTVIFNVTSSTVGAQPNTTSGVSTTQITTVGAASNTATLTVLGPPTIAKAFSPTMIPTGGTSTVTLTLTNNNTTLGLTGGAFTDALNNMSAAGGAVTGTCVGTTPSNLTTGATSLSFSGIAIPANSVCSVVFSVTSSTTGNQPNTTSGVTTNETPTAGTASNTANLMVLALPTIGKSFSPTSIQPGGTSAVKLTLTNPNSIALTSASFSDTLANMTAAGGAVTGTCPLVTPNMLTAGSTLLGFIVPNLANGSCTVIFSVTSSTLGTNPNTASGVSTTQTPTPGPPSAIATLTVIALPTISKVFVPTTIQSGATSVVTLTLSNTNAFPLTGGAFTDALANMTAVGGQAGGTCAGANSNTLTAGATSLSLTGITIPTSSSCTVTFSITSSTPGVQTNSTSGVTTTQAPTAGSVSNTANLTVLAPPTIAKSFNPTSIPSGGTSLVTLTLGNSNSTSLTGGAFTDMLANMTAAGGAVGGTCVGTTPGTLTAGATALNFTGISIPASGSCTVTFSVTSSNLGPNPNTASGITTAQTPAAGLASNVATLTVTNLPTIAKAFNPTAIPSGGTSLVTLTLSNSGTSALTGGAFTDALTNMRAAGGAVGGTCAGTNPNNLSAGITSLSFTGIGLPAGSGCTVTFGVTSTTTGVQPNITSGVTTTQTPTAGPASNSATLTVLATPTIAKTFNPTTISSGGTSVVTLTLSNGNSLGLTGGAFTDTLANMSAAGGTVGGTCGASPGSLSAGATNLSFTGISIPASGSCTVTFSVTSTHAGTNPNTTSGVTTTQTPTAGSGSNTANLTVTTLATPTIVKAFNPTSITSGGTSTVMLTLTNPNASTLTGGAFTDTLVNMSAAGGAVTGTCAASPASLTGGATSLNFSAITIPATGNCTVIFSVTSSNVAVNPNTTSGVTTTQTPTAGAVSNTANLTVTSAAVAPTVVSYSLICGTSCTYNMIGNARVHLPWQVTGVQVVFSQAITAANASSLTGVSAGGFTGLGTTTLTWTFTGVTNGNIASALATSGPNAITSAGGTLTGSNTSFNLKILEGDFNDDGIVNASDLVLVNSARSAAYNIFADINGDGVVNTADIQVVQHQIGQSNP